LKFRIQQKPLSKKSTKKLYHKRIIRRSAEIKWKKDYGKIKHAEPSHKDVPCMFFLP
jgi:hypothetical protein